ncbi:hypothetical protein QZQ97_15205 [Serratia sp. root2]|uniref:hypothetical protein n=1 Tax=Serratia sp. root2 TaxID=3059676 RepID=UPI00288DFB97|nr:hypothetical protein [Serratia sp. root2]MDT3252270.1 hypothetical protein [Serratia sp. root2]
MDNLIKENISPFLSILLAEINDGKNHLDAHKAVFDIISTEGRAPNTVDLFGTKGEDIGELGSSYFTPYKIRTIPTWLKGSELLDLENHVFVSISVGNYIAFYFSEKGMKDEIRSYFSKSRLLFLTAIDIKKLNYNFINEDNVKMLWLLGIHGKNSFKADSKVLGGDNVADTLDPLNDQSYMMSAVRTEIGDTKRSIGLNPFKSSIWRGPCKDWSTFENRVVEILDILSKNSKIEDTPIGILAYPISEMKGIKTPYEFSIIDCDFFPEEDGQRRKELLKKLKNNYFVEVNPSLASHNISITIYYKNHNIGEIKVEPEINDYAVSFNIVSKNYKTRKPFEDYIKIFQYPELIKCWYESGHALINGMLFKTDYRDVSYNSFLWAGFEGYNIKQEKPEVNNLISLDNIGKQNSLFCWVKKGWNGKWIKPENFNTTENPLGWLYCDDGAGEKADFIHVVEHDELIILSLIHVKAANTESKNRRVSVGAHDIVLNQAIKNLRYCSRKTLSKDLRDRFDNSTRKYCWKDDNPTNPEDFIKYLESIEKSSNFRKRVIVIQPHTQKSCYHDNNNSNIKKQLDVLLVSTDNAIRASGAEFHIVGLDDSGKK